MNRNTRVFFWVILFISFLRGRDFVWPLRLYSGPRGEVLLTECLSDYLFRIFFSEVGEAFFCFLYLFYVFTYFNDVLGLKSEQYYYSCYLLRLNRFFMSYPVTTVVTNTYFINMY